MKLIQAYGTLQDLVDGEQLQSVTAESLEHCTNIIWNWQYAGYYVRVTSAETGRSYVVEPVR